MSTKLAAEWSFDDLTKFIAFEPRENRYVELKSSAALQRTNDRVLELSKDVSAFANSVGGIIIYGVREDKERGVVEIDEGVSETEISKEWLEHEIDGNVRPRIPDLIIHVIRLPNRQNDRVAYVVVIPESYTVHQAADRRYYKRYNFQKVPMEDYEVRVFMNRSRHPRMELQLLRRVDREDKDNHEYTMWPILRNVGLVRAIDLKLLLYFPQPFIIDIGASYKPVIDWRDGGVSCQYKRIEWKRPQSVIFPGDELNLGEHSGYTIRYRMNSDLHRLMLDLSPVIKWTLYADDALPVRGERPLADYQRF